MNERKIVKTSTGAGDVVEIVLPKGMIDDTIRICERFGLDPSDVIASMIKDWNAKRRAILDNRQTAMNEWLKKPL